MQKFNEFNTLLLEIQKTCDQIIKKSVPVMKHILTNQDQIVASRKDADPQVLKQSLKDVSFGIIEDAKVVKSEMKDFIECLVSLKGVEEYQETIPFFYRVFSGDMYDCEGMDALKALLADLTNQLEDCTIEKVLSKV